MIPSRKRRPAERSLGLVLEEMQFEVSGDSRVPRWPPADSAHQFAITGVSAATTARARPVCRPGMMRFCQATRYFAAM